MRVVYPSSSLVDTLFQESAPLVHQSPAQFEDVAAKVGRLSGVAHGMGQCRLHHVMARVGLLRRPVPEAGSEAVGNESQLESPEHLREGHV